MARGATITVENSFTRGLITEYSAMNFPEDAVTDGDNVVFSELGKVRRRPGINLETGAHSYALGPLTAYPGVYTEYRWDSVGGQGLVFLVQQVGATIRFFEVTDGALSGGLKAFNVNLLSFKTNVSNETVAENYCQFAAGKGYLFIVHPFCDPIAVKYNNDDDSIETTRIEIQVRDFERLDDGLDTDERPKSLTNIHKYNLYNQGWYFNAIVHGDNSPRNVLTAWDAQRSDFPSNADIWWVYKDGQEIAYFGAARTEGKIGPSQVTMGNTPAPNGHYIYSAWLLNRTALTGISGLPTKTAGVNRPSAIAFFAGRIFYAAVSADGYADKLFFTQIIESDDQFGKCYQINDPTSETIFDLLDTDGGVIDLPLISKVSALQVLGDALIVLGTNGCFAIRGSDNGPFRATDYTVEYVSEIGTASPQSIVNVDGNLIWWNYDAIYALGKDQIGVSFQVQNISKPTIQSIVDSIPPDNKQSIKGVYNKKDRIVQWLFNDQFEPPDFYYNRILELNVVSNAFYTHTISEGSNKKIVGLISISGSKASTVPDVVRALDNTIVTDLSGETVVTEKLVSTPNVEVFKYTTLTDDKLTYSNQVDEHRDWGSSFNSFFESGYRIRGELLRKFNSTPIAVTLEWLEDGDLIIQGIWDYGARKTTKQSLYLRKTDIGDYFIRRVKLRGKGRSFQLRFESVGDAPFSLVGWSTFDTGGQVP